MADNSADTADSQQHGDKQIEQSGKQPERISTDFTHRKALPKAFDLSQDTQTAAGVSAQEMQFVRRVTELLPILSPEQVEALRDRIASGYYGNPEVTRIIAQRLSEIFGTD